jgi:hypothetical protein
MLDIFCVYIMAEKKCQEKFLIAISESYGSGKAEGDPADQDRKPLIEIPWEDGFSGADQ